MHVPARIAWRPLALVVAAIVLGVVLLLLDWREAAAVLRQSRWSLLPLALGATVLSYAALSYGFALVAGLFRIRTSSGELFLLGFASNAVNNMVSMSGIPGYSLRLLVLKRRAWSSCCIITWPWV
jgi:uncharacterized membrane protein YbhN (UPF0104 family)